LATKHAIMVFEMPATQRIPITPAVLVWARQSINLAKDVAAKRLAVSEQTLDKWESVTLNQR